jgi:hypothetical protein
LVEGILYLTKSDEEFVSTYVDNKKGWFWTYSTVRKFKAHINISPVSRILSISL